MTTPIKDFAGFTAWMLAGGHTLNPCRDEDEDEHIHVRSPDGYDGIIWADGRVSEFDLTQPARCIYPSYEKHRIIVPFRNDMGVKS